MTFNANFKDSKHVGVEKTILSLRELKKDLTKVIVCPKQYQNTFTYHYDKDIFANYNSIDEKLWRQYSREYKLTRILKK